MQMAKSLGNRYSIDSGSNSESCVNLFIDLKRNEAHILFIKKNDSCNLSFIEGQGNLANLVYISLKLFETINYDGNVYLDDNAQAPVAGGIMRSISLLGICNEIMKGIKPTKYSKYNYYGFFIDRSKIEELEAFIKSINKNKCASANSPKLNSTLYKILENLVNRNYRQTISEFEKK
jgi:hypothetical protein